MTFGNRGNMVISKEQQKKNRKKWIKALRSGKYKQTQNYLCKIENGKPKYCCLGVLCEVLKVPGEIKKDGLSNFKFKEYGTKDKVDATLHSKSIRDLIGLRDGNGGFGEEGDTLTDLNDCGASFKKIADIIEKEPDGLFTKRK